ncbi:DUF58 domain-containing protein [Leucothrix arctica]|uniref:DUF58 domain-containing protein n=1 Tax=Leucothrix arctica TaxID=1481894 RepID=A0A317CDF1_9GAMM|nr:DUF58 domain-containing protein [Leucothrix arctica]PWQ94142.1 DUF58 domain-containing protein [Leucothrix arctica]
MNKASDNGVGLVYSSLEGLLFQQQSARLLQKRSRYRKTAIQTGNHQVRHLGRGMEFAESRPYSPGDDIRSIDWKVTARTGEPHTKLFEEERERPVLLWCDLRSNMFFATRGQFKSVVATELASLLAWKSWLDGDRVGGAIISSDQQHEMRPARSKSKLLQLLQSLASTSQQIPDFSQASTVSLSDSWKRLRRVLPTGSQVILFSDFRGLDDSAERQLRRIARHSTVTIIHITDPFEHQLPQKTQLKLSDGLRFLRLNTTKKDVNDDYSQRDLNQSKRLKQLSMQCHARLIEISTDDSVKQRLAKLRGAIL